MRKRESAVFVRLFKGFSILFLLISWSVLARATPPEKQTEFSYQIEGVVKGLPKEGGTTREILIKHEEIPDYRDRDGQIVGMHAMTMPFYLDSSISLSGISVGDKVKMTLKQQLEPRFSEQVSSIEKVN